MQKTDSAKELLKPQPQHLQTAVALHLRRQALDVHDHHVRIVEQPLTHRLLQTVPPGGQLWPALKHIQARADRLQSTAENKNMKLHYNKMCMKISLAELENKCHVLLFYFNFSPKKTNKNIQSKEQNLTVNDVIYILCIYIYFRVKSGY